MSSAANVDLRRRRQGVADGGSGMAAMMSRLHWRAAMNPSLLALDTATDALAVALLTPAGRWHANEPGGALASARLLPLVEALLREAGTRLQALDAIAFGQGPGAFTGLRTACAVAQGLGLGSGRPLLAVDSLLIVAEDARQQAEAAGLATSGAWWVAMDARMDEAYAAAYFHDGHGWQPGRAPQLYTLPALAAAWAEAPPQRVAGNALAAFSDRLPAPGAACWAEVQDRAAALGRLAEAAWGRQALLDPADALPLYLRDKVALTTAERQAGQQMPQRALPAGR